METRRRSSSLVVAMMASCGTSDHAEETDEQAADGSTIAVDGDTMTVTTVAQADVELDDGVTHVRDGLITET